MDEEGARADIPRLIVGLLRCGANVPANAVAPSPISAKDELRELAGCCNGRRIYRRLLTDASVLCGKDHESSRELVPELVDERHDVRAGRYVERLLVECGREPKIVLVQVPEQRGLGVAVDGFENRAAFFLSEVHRDIEAGPAVGVEKCYRGSY